MKATVAPVVATVKSEAPGPTAASAVAGRIFPGVPGGSPADEAARVLEAAAALCASLARASGPADGASGR